MSEYLIYEQKMSGRMYLTDIPNDDDPIGGIGFRGSNDGSIPNAAGTCPTIEDAEKVIAYLHDAISGPRADYRFEAKP